MPIPFSCQHCGHYTLVSDDFAGKTGPCSACGAEVTVPLIQAPQRSVGIWWIAAPFLGIIAVAMALMAVMATVVSSRGGTVRLTATTASNTINENKFRLIAAALHSYHEANGSFPPAYMVHEASGARTSWRVLLLPHMQKQQLYDAYQMNKQWNSDANSDVRNATVGFQATGVYGPSPLETNFVLVTGSGTAFEGDTAKSFADMKDGTSNIVIAVQVQSLGVEWTQPDDIHINELPTLLKSGVLTDESGMVRYMLADGQVRQMSPTDAIKQLPAMTLIDSSAPVGKPK